MFHRSVLVLLFILFPMTSSYAQEDLSSEVNSFSKEKSSRFIVITPEKCGTFLLSKALHLITGKGFVHYYPRKVENLDDFFTFVENAHNNTQFVFCHVSPDQSVVEGLKKSGYKVFFILRDPRDQLVSGMYMIREGHPLGGIPPHEFKKLYQDEQIEELITGEIFGKPIFEVCYSRQLPWIREKSKFVHVSRFEQLVGEKGGGDDSLQQKAIKSLGKHLGIKISSRKAEKIGQQLFGETWSFRSGKIGSYKTHFSEEHINLYYSKYYQSLVDLGYE